MDGVGVRGSEGRAVEDEGSRAGHWKRERPIEAVAV
jgi:hypothetical protein